MSTFVLLTLTGLGLAALYFLVASGLVAGLRPRRRAELRARAVPVRRRVRHLVGRRATCPAPGPTGWGFVLAVVFGVRGRHASSPRSSSWC